ncbi:DUF3833 domain-containing protein [Azoarcus sp. KH32C]|uniref:DUF3833 domain-containing protein n=1 Tax=Azoarcus sp. KH32C TaxID=748247 RepID=UPI0002385D44|nr:DUF3833 domain-containing protein [Azoarcus sp. KH32C]BAL27525.1 putative lipoprotein [Azoarcus sp. KH32C]
MKLLAATLLPFCLTACVSNDIDRYRAEQPQLDLRTYFNGTLDAWGIFQGRSREVTKRFHVVIEARWDGDTGVLDEQFRWSDGKTSRRVWILTRQADGSFRGRADDVIGEAVGEVAGNTLRWRYVLALPVDDKVYHVNFDDWMFLLDDRVMLNRSYMSKWGFHLGEVSLAFRKRLSQP